MPYRFTDLSRFGDYFYPKSVNNQGEIFGDTSNSAAEFGFLLNGPAPAGIRTLVQC